MLQVHSHALDTLIIWVWLMWSFKCAEQRLVLYGYAICHLFFVNIIYLFLWLLFWWALCLLIIAVCVLLLNVMFVTSSCSCNAYILVTYYHSITILLIYICDCWFYTVAQGPESLDKDISNNLIDLDVEGTSH